MPVGPVTVPVVGRVEMVSAFVVLEVPQRLVTV